MPFTFEMAFLIGVTAHFNRLNPPSWDVMALKCTIQLLKPAYQQAHVCVMITWCLKIVTSYFTAHIHVIL